MFSRRIFVTSKNCLDFLENFRNLFEEKTDEMEKSRERLRVGIVRIDEASFLIQKMDKDLEKQRFELGNFLSAFFSERKENFQRFENEKMRRIARRNHKFIGETSRSEKSS